MRKEANEAFTNWGITTIPEFEDYPGVAGGGAWTYGISNTSEHKEAAFEVLKFLLADEQLVKYYSIFGDISRFPLDSPSLREKKLNLIRFLRMWIMISYLRRNLLLPLQDLNLKMRLTVMVSLLIL
ncbi:hypothetical protein ACA29_15275 [Lederbergia galactosidilytica]|uniref:Uncharacterized protein n=1 Tax=Lederbergia galactosidilytica TaxID=217031 RepID=A0A0Q9Y294_9BACI|nr:hypothetical protein ACA29_15275 [Lederbergia galactosidilytica]